MLRGKKPQAIYLTMPSSSAFALDMNVRVISGIHSSFFRIEPVLRRERAADGIVVCGGFTTRGTTAEAADAVSLLRKAGAPIFAAAGNMD
jgi:predicted phosphodiesterase